MNVLAIFAHPDDETMLTGGTLAILGWLGATVQILSATRGEGGETGNPPLVAQEQLGAVRVAELQCAMQALGAQSVSFFDYVDPLVGPDDTLFAFTEDVETLVGKLDIAIRHDAPQVVLTHGSNGEYGHPAHLLVHQAVVSAIDSIGEGAPVLYTVQAYFPEHPRLRLANQNDPADLVVDVSSGIPRKVAAAQCHRTQHDLFTRRTAEEVGHPVTVEEAVSRIRVESLHRARPPAMGERPDDPLAEMLREAGVLIKGQ